MPVAIPSVVIRDFIGLTVMSKIILHLTGVPVGVNILNRRMLALLGLEGSCQAIVTVGNRRGIDDCFDSREGLRGDVGELLESW